MIIEKDDIFKIVPAITTIFVFSGIVKAIFYYSIFGINIIDYAEWNEYLFFFLNNIVDLTIMGLLIFSAWWNVHLLNNENYMKSFPFSDKFKQAILFVLPLLSGILVAALFIDFTRSLLLKGSLGIVIIYIVCFGYSLQFFLGMRLFKKMFRSDFVAKVFKTISALIIVFFILVVPAYIKAYRIIKIRSDRDQLTLYLKDQKTKSTNDSLLYIGKTHQFYFFYDVAKKQSEIINISYVDSSKIVRKPFYSVIKALDPMR
jgi:hypothetical protein